MQTRKIYNIGFRESERYMMEQLKLGTPQGRQAVPYIKRLLWFYLKFEDVYAEEKPFMKWLPEHAVTYSFDDKNIKFIQLMVTDPAELELLERAGKKNRSNFIKYLIDTEEEVTNIILNKVRNNNCEQVHSPKSDINITNDSNSMKEQERISEINDEELARRNEQKSSTIPKKENDIIPEKTEEDEISTEALEAARKSFGNLFN